MSRRQRYNPKQLERFWLDEKNRNERLVEKLKAFTESHIALRSEINELKRQIILLEKETLTSTVTSCSEIEDLFF